MTVAQAAERLARSENSVRRLIAEGKLPAARVQGERIQEYRLRATDVDVLRGRLNALPPGRSLAQIPEGVSELVPRLQALTDALTRLSAQADEREEARRAEEEAHTAERERLEALTREQAAELGALRERAARMERLEAELDRMRRPWWRRLLG